ncbi:MAG: phosphate uptake regulator PhoU [Odoribacter sp.]|nr:phosphate uptake regulator PhoU [Odoribacter sp.]
MAKLVLKQIGLMRQMFQNEIGIYDEIIQNEHLLDSLEVKIEDEVINTIVLYSPRASDLRKMMSFYNMASFVERVGDLLMKSARGVQSCDKEGRVFLQFQPYLLKLLAISEKIIQNAIFAFTYEDIRLAKETLMLDDEVDRIHLQILSDLKEVNAGLVLSAQELNDILSIHNISCNLERVGDNATNMAESAVYLIEGKNIKHVDNNDENTLFAGSEG